MVVYKNYGKGFLSATLISAIGGVCGFAALSAIIILIRGGFKEPQYLIIVVLGLIGYFAFRLATGTTEFDAVDRARLVLPDKTEYVYEDKSDICYFTSLLSRSSVISTAVRDISEETPASLYLNDTKYDIVRPSAMKSPHSSTCPASSPRTIATGSSHLNFTISTRKYL